MSAFPAGTALGKVSVTVRDRAGRRSNKRGMTVIALAPLPSSSAAYAGALPPVLAGNGMWIWYVSKSEGGNLDAIAARAKAAGMSTVFVKSADGADVWSQFTPQLVSELHARGLRVCAWQFVYGLDRRGGDAAAASIADGADRFVIDAETAYEGATRRRRVPCRAAQRDRPGLSARLHVVSVCRLPPAPAVLGLPRAGRRAGQPAAGLLEGDRRHASTP